MAVVSHVGLNRTVADIAERDALLPKIDGMVVMVNDTTGDLVAGTGIASYKWNAAQSAWLLQADDDAVTFTSTHKSVVENTGTVADFEGALT